MVLLVSAIGFAGAFLLTFGLNWFALRPWRRAAGQHWTERARLLFPARGGARLNIYLIPVACGMVAELLGMHGAADFTWLLVASWLGALLGTYPFDREVLPWMRWQDWVHTVVASWTLKFCWLGLLAAAALLMPDDIGWDGVLLFVLVAGLQIWLNLGLLLSLLKLLHVVQPADARLLQVVSETAHRMGLPVPRVMIIRITASYAAAMPLNQVLLFSPRLLELHPDDELAAITAHELAHLTESRATNCLRLLPAMAFLPVIFLKPAIASQSEFAGVALVSAFAILYSTTVLVRRRSRRMEVRADKTAAENQPQEGVYARALERLYQANQMPAVMRSKRMVHPHLYDRLLAAGITPAYPRPLAPPKSIPTVTIVGVALGLLLAALAMKHFG